MKILMVTMGLGIGGAETHIVALSLALKAQGHEIFVASAGGIYEETLVSAGIAHVTLPLNEKKPPSLARSYYGLKKLIRRENFDIVHAHARIPALVLGWLKKRMGFRFVTTDHAEFRVTPFLKKMTNWGDRTLAVSEDLRTYLLKNYDISPDRITLTVNGVDTARFSPVVQGDLKKEMTDDGRAVILHVSRLDKEVSLCAERLMDAMRRLAPRAKLVIVGDGDRRAALAEKAKVLNETLGAETITFCGARTDVERFMAAADVAVAPSRAAMEALSSGKITVVSGSEGHGGIFSPVISEAAVKSNFCFRENEPATAEMLAREIETALALSADEKETLTSFGREFICRYYSIEEMMRSQLAVYEELMAIPSPLCGATEVLICGYYGYGNMGDEDLLSVITREMRRQKPGIRITALSSDPKKTRREHLVDAVYRFDIPRIMRMMKTAKLFLFGGGNLLQDKTSTRSLIYYTEMLRLAHRAGVKIAVFAGGIGPVSEKNTLRVMQALSLVDRISLRDKNSLRFLNLHLPEKEAQLVFDPAVLEQKTAVFAPSEDYFVVIPKKCGKRAEETLTSFVGTFAKSRALKPIVISMFDGEDLRFAKRFSAAVGGELFSPRNAGELIGIIEGAKLLVSSRLHGLIYAAVSETPMMSYSADGKLSSFLSYIGAADCAGSMDSDVPNLLDIAERAIMGGEALASRLQEEKPRYRALVREEISVLLEMTAL
ncbi:MAG: glycosyltransferase [Clostridia bacterium]|nr:glycosyltransferase [Clostridia bacterium]